MIYALASQHLAEEEAHYQLLLLTALHLHLEPTPPQQQAAFRSIYYLWKEGGVVV
jgi:hypothetical protein